MSGQGVSSFIHQIAERDGICRDCRKKMGPCVFGSSSRLPWLAQSLA
jgi:hypothetical protein